MKRLSLFGFMIAFMLSLVSGAFCETPVPVISPPGTFGISDPFVVVTVSCTGSAEDGSIPDTTFSDEIMRFLKKGGYALVLATTVGNHGGTEPQEDSDVMLYMAAGGVTKAVDLLGGAGVGALDNTANRDILPEVGGINILRPIIDTLTLDVDQAATAVNSATYSIIFVFCKIEKL